jgi:hypothetical protein
MDGGFVEKVNIRAVDNKCPICLIPFLVLFLFVAIPGLRRSVKMPKKPRKNSIFEWRKFPFPAPPLFGSKVN